MRLTIEQMAKLRGAMDELAPRKRSKYRNIKVKVDGHTFDSKFEAARYGDLKLLQAAGEISGLQCQVPYRIEVGGMLICRYVADFVFQRGEKLVVADAKGVRTDTYLLKKKLMRAVHGVEIEEYRKEVRGARKP